MSGRRLASVTLRHQRDAGGLRRLDAEWRDGGLDPGIHLREAGVPIWFWSRAGD